MRGAPFYPPGKKENKQEMSQYFDGGCWNLKEKTTTSCFELTQPDRKACTKTTKCDMEEAKLYGETTHYSLHHTEIKF